MLYLDSADSDALARFLTTGLFRGVTTNPTILHRAGKSAADIAELHALTRDHGSREFFAQATGADVDQLRRSAHSIAAVGEDVVVKVPCTEAGLTLAAELTGAGTQVLVTAVYHPTQMLLAQAAGAQFIAPYVARSSDAGQDGVELISQLNALRQPGSPRILAASLRNVDQLARVAGAGADDLTINANLAGQLLDHHLTASAVAEFEEIAARS